MLPLGNIERLGSQWKTDMLVGDLEERNKQESGISSDKNIPIKIRVLLIALLALSLLKIKRF